MRAELTFDGKGINGPDEYRTRIATFSPNLKDEDVRKYGNLFATSPDLFTALQKLTLAYRNLFEYTEQLLKNEGAQPKGIETEKDYVLACQTLIQARAIKINYE